LSDAPNTRYLRLVRPLNSFLLVPGKDFRFARKDWLSL
jgi:hypothetical protein